MADNGSSRRQKAAQARVAAQSDQKRRERRMLIIGIGSAVVVGLLIVGGTILATNSASNSQSESATSTTTPDPKAPLPTGVLASGDAHEFGVPYGTAAASAPVLEIWEDFQCPACGAVEAAAGSTIAGLAEQGKVQLIWRPTTFLDANLQNDSSERAVAAWGCAIDAGKTREFHDAIYANQPKTEGDGYTQEQLLGLAGTAGITGDALTTFTSCVNDGTYRTWGANSTQVFSDKQIGGTPTAFLNGTSLDVAVLADPTKLEQAIADASK